MHIKPETGVKIGLICHLLELLNKQWDWTRYSKLEDFCGVVVKLLALYTRGRGFDPRLLQSFE